MTTHTAEASERIRGRIEAEENKSTDWLEVFLDVINPLSGGSLDEGADLDLKYREDRETNHGRRHRRPLEGCLPCSGMEQAVEDLVRSSLGVGLDQADNESEGFTE
jgi:hypothetical protein